MTPVLSPTEIAALAILHRPVMLAGMTDGWLLLRDGKVIDLWIRVA